MNDSHLFKLARECSFCADYSGNARIGCVVVYRGTVLAKGWNTNKTHTSQDVFNKWRYKNSGNRYLPSKAHAEIVALTKIKYLDIDFSKVHIYIYRELKDGHLGMARPCAACQAAIKALGIKNIHYTTNNGFVQERFLDQEDNVSFFS